jgi:hypothetical protein
VTLANDGATVLIAEAETSSVLAAALPFPALVSDRNP